MLRTSSIGSRICGSTIISRVLLEGGVEEVQRRRLERAALVDSATREVPIREKQDAPRKEEERRTRIRPVAWHVRLVHADMQAIDIPARLSSQRLSLIKFN